MATQRNYAQQMDAVLAGLGGTRPRLLLHACCGPCSSAVLEQLCRYFEITVLYYNPNTWPAAEYYRRGEELKKFVAQAHPLGVTVIEDRYDPQEYYTAEQRLENAPERELTEAEAAFVQSLHAYREKFIRAMDDDLNTADAISVIFEIVADANKFITAESGTAKPVIAAVTGAIRELGSVLGLLERKADSEIPAEVGEMLEERAQARKNRDWAASDAIRDQLKELGYAVKDTPQGQQLTKI